jgi:hypothetical protein
MPWLSVERSVTSPAAPGICGGSWADSDVVATPGSGIRTSTSSATFKNNRFAPNGGWKMMLCSVLAVVAGNVTSSGPSLIVRSTPLPVACTASGPLDTSEPSLGSSASRAPWRASLNSSCAEAHAPAQSANVRVFAVPLLPFWSTRPLRPTLPRAIHSVPALGRGTAVQQPDTRAGP